VADTVDAIEIATKNALAFTLSLPKSVGKACRYAEIVLKANQSYAQGFCKKNVTYTEQGYKLDFFIT